MSLMIIVFSKHALARMQTRGISKDAVEAALKAPDNIVQSEDYSLAVKRINSKVLLVAYKEMNGLLFIITAISSSKASKYLEK